MAPVVVVATAAAAYEQLSVGSRYFRRGGKVALGRGADSFGAKFRF